MLCSSDMWATKKRDGSNALVLQARVVPWSSAAAGPCGGQFRVCVIDETGTTALQIAVAETLDEINSDWNWAVTAVSDSKRNSMPFQKLCDVYFHLWNATAASSPQQQHKHNSHHFAKLPVEYLDPDDVYERLHELGKYMVTEIGLVDDAAFRVSRTMEYFDTNAYPRPRPPSPQGVHHNAAAMMSRRTVIQDKVTETHPLFRQLEPRKVVTFRPGRNFFITPAPSLIPGQK